MTIFVIAATSKVWAGAARTMDTNQHAASVPHKYTYPMSSYLLHGRELVFPAVPSSTIDAYRPVENTWELVWKSTDTTANLYTRIHLVMLEHIQCIDRLSQLEEKGYQIALFDLMADPSTRLLTDLNNYLRILFGKDYMLLHPSALADKKEREELARDLYTMNDEIIERYRNSRKKDPRVRAELARLLESTESLGTSLLSE